MTNPASSTPIFLSGLPGRMATEVALATRDEPWASRLRLLDVGLTGPGGPATQEIDGATVRLLPPDARDALDVPGGAIAVDFTEPTAALPNIAFYAARGIPFVLGTTGFDTEQARRLVAASSASAVIAPNMAIPIVLLQWAVAQAAARFPGALAGHAFGVMESHQSTKKDTSGTARALVRDFAKLGLPASEDAIKKIRDPRVQERELGVPPEHLTGHAYHYYTLSAGDGDVRLELRHLVNGRRVYATGALHAVEFLARRVAAGSRGQVYSMLDVLEAMHEQPWAQRGP